MSFCLDSFYSSSKQTSYSNFVPRIKLPNVLPQHKPAKIQSTRNALYRSPSRESTGSANACRNIPALVDYDEYDAQVFKIPTTSNVAAKS